MKNLDVTGSEKISVGSPFSLLLPVYRNDDPKNFQIAFKSATIEQTRAPDEVILVQDGPVGPELKEMIQHLSLDDKFPVKVIRFDHNMGLAIALDAGLQQCSYEIVARMDADDICVPSRFEKQVPLIEQGLDIVGSAILEFHANGEDGVIRLPPISHRKITKTSRFHSPFNHPSVVYRKSFVMNAGGYENLALLEDYWLFIRMIQRGAQCQNIPEPLVKYRVDSGAYARRGGIKLLRSEIILQFKMRKIGFTSRRQMFRNILIRCGYRIIPEKIRRLLYQRLLINRGD